MAYDLSTFNAMLREVVDDSNVIEAVNRSAVGLETLESKVDTTRYKEGKYIEFPTVTAGGEGGGTIGEDVALPTPGNHSTARSRFNAVHDYQRCKMSGPLLDASQMDDQAIEEVFSSALKHAKKDIRNRMNWALMAGDGSGRLTGITAASSTSSFTVSDRSFLRVGMYIALLNDSDATNAGTIKDDGASNDTGILSTQIATITPGSGTTAVVTIATAAASNFTTDYAQMSVYFVNGFAKQAWGLFAGADASNPSNQGTRYLGNINRSTAGNEYFKAQSDVDANQAPFDIETIIDPALDSVELGGFGGECPNIVFTNKNHWNYLGHTLREDVRYTGYQRKTKAGFSELQYNDTRFYYDRMFPAGYAIALHDSAVRRSILRKTSALNRGGGELQQYIDSNGRYDSWEFTLVTRYQNCFVNPALMVKMKNIGT